MNSKLKELLNMKRQPVAILKTDAAPEITLSSPAELPVRVFLGRFQQVGNPDPLNGILLQKACDEDIAQLSAWVCCHGFSSSAFSAHSWLLRVRRISPPNACSAQSSAG